MARLNLNLSKEEEVIAQASVHWASIIGPIILTLILGPFFLIGLFFVIRTVIRIYTTQLMLTSKNLKGKIGWINTNEMDSPLNKITAVSIDQQLLGKMFGYGTVVVTTASNTYYYKCIKSPINIKNSNNK